MKNMHTVVQPSPPESSRKPFNQQCWLHLPPNLLPKQPKQKGYLTSMNPFFLSSLPSGISRRHKRSKKKKEAIVIPKCENLPQGGKNKRLIGQWKQKKNVKISLAEMAR